MFAQGCFTERAFRTATLQGQSTAHVARCPRASRPKEFGRPTFEHVGPCAVWVVDLGAYQAQHPGVACSVGDSRGHPLGRRHTAGTAREGRESADIGAFVRREIVEPRKDIAIVVAWVVEVDRSKGGASI